MRDKSSDLTPQFFSSPASDFFSQRPEATWVSLLGPRCRVRPHKRNKQKIHSITQSAKTPDQNLLKVQASWLPTCIDSVMLPPRRSGILQRCSWASFVLVFWFFFFFSDSSVSCVESILLF